jgi:hypothetical protein
MNVCAFLSISFLQNDDEKEEKTEITFARKKEILYSVMAASYS